MASCLDEYVGSSCEGQYIILQRQSLKWCGNFIPLPPFYFTAVQARFGIFRLFFRRTTEERRLSPSYRVLEFQGGFGWCGRPGPDHLRRPNPAPDSQGEFRHRCSPAECGVTGPALGYAPGPRRAARQWNPAPDPAAAPVPAPWNPRAVPAWRVSGE